MALAMRTLVRVHGAVQMKQQQLSNELTKQLEPSTFDFALPAAQHEQNVDKRPGNGQDMQC